MIVTLDADGQHPPEEIPRLVAPVAAQQADVVLGARARTRAMPFGRRCTNWLSAALASRIGGRAGPGGAAGGRGRGRRGRPPPRPPQAPGGLVAPLFPPRRGPRRPRASGP